MFMPGVWILWSKKMNFVITFQKENGKTFTRLIVFIVKSLQKEQNSTNLLLWPLICWNKPAITPKWFNSLNTNSRSEPQKYLLIHQLIFTKFCLLYHFCLIYFIIQKFRSLRVWKKSKIKSNVLLISINAPISPV